MIYADLNKTDRRQIRYTYGCLIKLLSTLAAARLKMENVGLQIKDKHLKRSILSFVAETAPREEFIKKQMEMLSHTFPMNDLHKTDKDENDDLAFNCPFQCTKYYEQKIVSAFRFLLNDAGIFEDIRNAMQSQLNEMLYSYQKIKLLNSFSLKELSNNNDIF